MNSVFANAIIPERIAFEVTNVCNIHCSICDHPILAQQQKPLSTDLILSTIDDAARLGTREITISGGEPLLHPGIEAVIARIKSRRIQQILISNGVLLTPEKIEDLLRLGVNRFVISVNGKQESDDEIRGKNVHVRAINAIRYLIGSGHGARTTVNVTITAKNCESLDEIRAYLQGLGVRSITFSVFSHFFLVRNVEVKKREFGLSPDQLTKVLPYLGSVESGDENRQNPCGHVLTSCVIHNSGLVAPCWNYDSKFNLHQRPLRDILHSAEYREYATYLSGKPETPCDTCYLACYNLVNSRLQRVVPLTARQE